MRGSSALSILAVGVLGGACAQAPRWTPSDAIAFESPSDLQLVDTPLEIRWRGGDGVRADDRFAVFVDRAPIRPGQNLRAVAGSDESCEQAPGCPDDEYLRVRGVYVTDQESLQLPFVSELSGIDAQGSASVHQVVLILVDGQGDRIGEHAATLSFRVPDS
jgi:hypothetical protein